MELISVSGGFINYSYTDKPSQIFSVIGGTSRIEDKALEAGDAFLSSTYYGANVFCNPIETIGLGLEVTSGTRTNSDKQKGSATRVSMLAKFDFLINV